MPPFAHEALLWGLPIVGLPVLIHLINMLRHRRVEWAAMEFLLVSQKRNRTWVLFRQLLLLLLRMLAVATVVLLVARPLLHNRLGSLLGSTQTHHILLLDDSFSMSDRWADTSAFAQAKMVVNRIAAVLAQEQNPQTFTLLRFSRVTQPDRGTRPDLLKETVDTGFTTRMVETLRAMQPSQTGNGPAEAIEAIGQLLGDGRQERRIVYLISDFRARQWDDSTDLRRQLLELNAADAEIHLINCVDRAHPNLAIALLAPTEGIRVAGVPWFMEVAVQNFGTTPVRDVPVLLEEDGHARASVTVAEIPPGRTVRERFPVHFPTAGQHEITARLESDAVGVDNVRYGTIHLPIDVPVLLIDGGPDARDARYLDMVLAPGGSIRTGITPQIETAAYLNGTRPLDRFGAIVLANIERLDIAGIESLRQYVAAGGGLAFFLGEQSRSLFFNGTLYCDGQGLFPLPLGEATVLPVDRLERGPDLQVAEHGVFRVFAGKRNSFLATVIVEQYFAAADGWEPGPDSTTRVIARLRNGAPLVIEHRFGKGRVLSFLTTASPVWNNWARNPSFVVAMQDMVAYLSQRAAGDISHRVGARLQLELEAKEYQPQVRFATPGEDVTPTATVDAVRSPEGVLVASLSETDVSGMYEARLTRTNGTTETRRFALNVEPEEGNLAALSGPQLATRLDGVDYRYEQADAFQYSVTQLGGYDVSRWLLYLLVVLLIGEQLLAYAASYHPPACSRAAEGGVR
ncbi:MAG: BatA domain-containing protein [Pirellulales bacterium]|nr:BatA domain-containing protein [Pirellulales bacterium]